MERLEREKLRELAEEAIDEFFETSIDPIVDGLVTKIVDEYKIEDEDDIDYLKAKIRHGILKWDE